MSMIESREEEEAAAALSTRPPILAKPNFSELGPFLYRKILLFLECFSVEFTLLIIFKIKNSLVCFPKSFTYSNNARENIPNCET